MKPFLFSKNMKLADMITADYHLILTLPKFGIPLGFGDKKVSEICAENHIPEDFFILICNICSFNSYIPDKETVINTNMQFLIPYLSASHRYYLDLQLPHIEKHLHRISNDTDPKYGLIINRFFENYIHEVREHFNYEETHVFPYLLSLINHTECFNYKIKIFKESHTNIEDSLNDLTQIVFKYLPENISTDESINLIFDIMELLSDLNKHIIIEEQILIPYVEFLEKQKK